MADKNREIAEAVVSAVGGAANITSVTHCMTRLRFVLKDQSIPNKEEIANIKGVMGTNIAGGQFQVIIGNSVGNVYKEVVAITGVSDNAGAGSGQPAGKVNPVTAALDFISGCMTPLFTAIIAGGLIKVLLVIFGPTLLGGRRSLLLPAGAGCLHRVQEIKLQLLPVRDGCIRADLS